MISCIVTGHGTFAPGLTGALEMIAGPQENWAALPFREEESLQVFEENMQTTVKQLMKTSDGLLIFADLLGGTPFRTAMLAAAENPKVAVIAGVNLPALIEASGLRLASTDASHLAHTIVAIGKDGLLTKKLVFPNENAPNYEEEGI